MSAIINMNHLPRKVVPIVLLFFKVTLVNAQYKDSAQSFLPLQVGHIWNYRLTFAIIHGQVVTNIENNFLFPSQFSLKQNYPNPFNPTTRIQYEIPVTSEIRLYIYNIRGQKIRTLVEDGSAGEAGRR